MIVHVTSKILPRNVGRIGFCSVNVAVAFTPLDVDHLIFCNSTVWDGWRKHQADEACFGPASDIFAFVSDYISLTVVISCYIAIFVVEITESVLTVFCPIIILSHEGSMVLLYMVCHGSHQYTPFMLALIYQHHGSYHSLAEFWITVCLWIWFTEFFVVHILRFFFNVLYYVILLCYNGKYYTTILCYTMLYYYTILQWHISDKFGAILQYMQSYTTMILYYNVSPCFSKIPYLSASCPPWIIFLEKAMDPAGMEATPSLACMGPPESPCLEGGNDDQPQDIADFQSFFSRQTYGIIEYWETKYRWLFQIRFIYSLINEI